MDIALLIRQRLGELGLDQKDLAAAAQVTESYISQLLCRKKAPPAAGRTDLYDKLGEFLKLPPGELARLAGLQRTHDLKKRSTEPPRPLFQACRDLILRKCKPQVRAEVCAIFEKEPFGELERLVTQKLLDVVQSAVREELRSEDWLRSMAQRSGHSYEQMRVEVLEFLDTDVFQVSMESCVAFLEPVIDAWDMNLKTFAMEIILNSRLSTDRVRRIEFVEKPEPSAPIAEPGLEQFLSDTSLRGDATPEEVEFLRGLRFTNRRPTALYYYRELQSLRDPLHFPSLAGRGQ